MKRRLVGLIRKEFIQFFRDKVVVVFVFLMFLETALCGWALTLEVRNMSMVVYDADRSVESRRLIDAFDRLESFRLVRYVEDPSAINRLMDGGVVKLALIIPPNFNRAVKGNDTAEVQLLFDGSISIITSQAIADARGLLRDYNAQIALERIERTKQSGLLNIPQLENLVRIWYNPELKYVYFVMLSMLNISVLVLGMLLPAASLVREKEYGTLEQLMVTPTTAVELIIAKTFPMILLKTFGLAIGVAMALWVFDVPLRGSWLLFFAFSMLMFLSSIGIGILVGTLTQNMQQTLFIGFFIFFPMAFLSGTNVPISNMSPGMQWLSYLSPLRYYFEATLGIFLKGVGLNILGPQALALTVIGLVLLSYSAFRLRSNLA